MNDPPTPLPEAESDYQRQLREMNEALLVSSVRQHELTEQAEKAEAALRESHARFEALFDTSPIGIYLVDAELRIRQVNRTARPVFGAIGELIGRDFVEVIHILWPKAYADEIVHRFRHTLESGEPYLTPQRIEQRLDRGVTEYYEWQIHRLALPEGQYGVVCYFVDIAARVLAEQSLREAEERFRHLADNIPQLAWIADVGTDGQVHWFNKTWFEYTGTTLEQMKGQGWHAVHHPEHAERVIRKFAHHVREGLDWEDTFPLRGKDGRYRWFLSRMKVIRDESGAVVRIFGTNTDITEQRQMADALRQNATDMSEADRRKDEFLAMLSHELRNPLAPIANAVQLLRLQREKEGPLAREARGIIERQVGQLKHLVDDLLEVSRITTGRVQLRQERVAVTGIVERAVETTHPLIVQRRHELTVLLPPQPVWLHADAGRLEQVVVNLLTNAAKYTDEGGYIRLSVELTSRKREQPEECVLRVRDTGIGIAPELLPRIFDLFTQAERSLDRSEGGLGIGLCLVQRLVELHGGTVEAHSVLGTGSEFVVRLPVMRTAGPQPPATPNEAAEPTASLRVLVVDDNVDAVESLAMLLRLSRHEVRTAHDGPTALEAALDFLPNVVLLDIGLPGLNGYTVAKRLRQQPAFRSALLVAMTGYGQDTDRQQAQAAGFDHYLVKPADHADLMKLLAGVQPTHKP